MASDGASDGTRRLSRYRRACTIALLFSIRRRPNASKTLRQTAGGCRRALSTGRLARVMACGKHGYQRVRGRRPQGAAPTVAARLNRPRLHQLESANSTRADQDQPQNMRPEAAVAEPAASRCSAPATRGLGTRTRTLCFGKPIVRGGGVDAAFNDEPSRACQSVEARVTL